jgi:dynein heavy chain
LQTFNLCNYFLSFCFKDSLRTIYNSILSQHLAGSHNAPFTQAVQRYTPQLVDGALSVHQRVAATFLPTAIKFHYIFNLRDLSNIFQVKFLLLFIGKIQI